MNNFAYSRDFGCGYFVHLTVILLGKTGVFLPQLLIFSLSKRKETINLPTKFCWTETNKAIEWILSYMWLK